MGLKGSDCAEGVVSGQWLAAWEGLFLALVGGGNKYGTEFRYRTILVGELVGIVAGWRSGYCTILVGELVGIVRYNSGWWWNICLLVVEHLLAGGGTIYVQYPQHYHST
jgi:hypothetical protein